MAASSSSLPSPCRVAAVIVAAGGGVRAGGGTPKQYRALGGSAMLRHSLLAFATHPLVHDVQAVIHPDFRASYDAAAAGLDVQAPVAGGGTRQASVRAGLEALAADPPDLVLIHDAARPMVSAALIGRVLAALETHDAALPAIPVADTLKRVEDRLVQGTVPREHLWAAQTPQGFRFARILAWHRDAATDDGGEATDDILLAEAAGVPVALVEGDVVNFKVTTAEDSPRAEALLGMPGGAASVPDIRTGMGFDVHAFAEEGQPEEAGIRLCGVTVPSGRRLVGHSDADVGLHAVVDALLGALGEGDIGRFFPPSDPRWKGADSAIFVRRVCALLEHRRAAAQHVDVTLICQTPKIAPYRDAMRARVAGLLNIPPQRVNIKATTTERLGFTGRNEGIAAQAGGDGGDECWKKRLESKGSLVRRTITVL